VLLAYFLRAPEPWSRIKAGSPAAAPAWMKRQRVRSGEAQQVANPIALVCRGESLLCAGDAEIPI
jgi:hypothetical protein